MRHGHAVTINRVAVDRRFRRLVHHQLVAVEIEIDPGFRRPAFGAAQHGPIELAGSRKIINRDSKVEGIQGVSPFKAASWWARASTLRLAKAIGPPSVASKG